MSEYRYNYQSPPGHPNNNNNNNDGLRELISWGIIVVAFMAFWPLGLVLLFRKLSGAGKHSRSANRQNNTRYYYTQSAGQARSSTYSSQSAPSGATGGARSATGEYHYTYQKSGKSARDEARDDLRGAARDLRDAAQDVKNEFQSAKAKSQAKAQAKTKAQDQSPTGRKLPSGKGLTIAGSIVGGVFGFTFLMAFLDALTHGTFRYDLAGLGSLLAFTGLGVVLLAAGVGKSRKRRRYLKYLGLIGRRESVSIATLVNATGWSRKKVCDDLQDMLDAGVLPQGYLDLSTDQLVLSDEGIADAPAAEEAAAPTRGTPEEENDILREIREVNDQIPDEVMSAKIDRIEEITGKILDYQREHPNKAGQLRSFLNYYLPTTLKVLRAYAQLDKQGVEGENISAAKARVEGMMDKVVEGFEKQLDKLFQNDALDITSDVAVLEKMLDNDGLSDSGFPMGAAGSASSGSGGSSAAAAAATATDPDAT